MPGSHSPPTSSLPLRRRPQPEGVQTRFTFGGKEAPGPRSSASVRRGMGWARPAAPGRAARRGAGGRRATARRSAGGARRRGPPACGRCRGRLGPRRPARPRCVPSPGPRRPGLGTGCGGGRAEHGGAAAPRAGAEPGERLTEEQAVVLRVGMAALLRAVQGHDATRGAGGGGPHAPPSADAQQRQQRAHGGGRTARLGGTEPGAAARRRPLPLGTGTASRGWPQIPRDCLSSPLPWEFTTMHSLIHTLSMSTVILS